MLKIAIIGSRGIPNRYGGFEQFAEHLSLGLVERGHRVTVYCPHFHPLQEPTFRGVDLRHVYCPERTIGSAANFLYDFLALRDALKRDFDIVYEAGYQSSALSLLICRVHKKRQVIVTNMDGMEWQRAKWGRLVKGMTRWFEKLAVEKSDYLITDNPAIQDYYRSRYGTEGVYIPYGADPEPEFDDGVLTAYGLSSGEFFLCVARLEPENNLEDILAGVLQAETSMPLVVVGPHHTRYGRYLKSKYRDSSIRFAGGIYEKKALNSLRRHSRLYFHGHSVGGTNPALLEAMAAGALIVAHDNPFNRCVLGGEAFYFNNRLEIGHLLGRLDEIDTQRQEKIDNNRRRIATEYAWEKIVADYEQFFYKAEAT